LDLINELKEIPSLTLDNIPNNDVEEEHEDVKEPEIEEEGLVEVMEGVISPNDANLPSVSSKLVRETEEPFRFGIQDVLDVLTPAWPFPTVSTPKGQAARGGTHASSARFNNEKRHLVKILESDFASLAQKRKAEERLREMYENRRTLLGDMSSPGRRQSSDDDESSTIRSWSTDAEDSGTECSASTASEDSGEPVLSSPETYESVHMAPSPYAAEPVLSSPASYESVEKAPTSKKKAQEEVFQASRATSYQVNPLHSWSSTSLGDTPQRPKTRARVSSLTRFVAKVVSKPSSDSSIRHDYSPLEALLEGNSGDPQDLAEISIQLKSTPQQKLKRENAPELIDSSFAVAPQLSHGKAKARGSTPRTSSGVSRKPSTKRFHETAVYDDDDEKSNATSSENLEALRDFFLNEEKLLGVSLGEAVRDSSTREEEKGASKNGALSPLKKLEQRRKEIANSGSSDYMNQDPPGGRASTEIPSSVKSTAMKEGEDVDFGVRRTSSSNRSVRNTSAELGEDDAMINENKPTDRVSSVKRNATADQVDGGSIRTFLQPVMSLSLDFSAGLKAVGSDVANMLRTKGSWTESVTGEGSRSQPRASAKHALIRKQESVDSYTASTSRGISGGLRSAFQAHREHDSIENPGSMESHTASTIQAIEEGSLSLSGEHEPIRHQDSIESENRSTSRLVEDGSFSMAQGTAGEQVAIRPQDGMESHTPSTNLAGSLSLSGDHGSIRHQDSTESQNQSTSRLMNGGSLSLAPDPRSTIRAIKHGSIPNKAIDEAQASGDYTLIRKQDSVESRTPSVTPRNMDEGASSQVSTSGEQLLMMQPKALEFPTSNVAGASNEESCSRSPAHDENTSAENQGALAATPPSSTRPITRKISVNRALASGVASITQRYLASAADPKAKEEDLPQGGLSSIQEEPEPVSTTDIRAVARSASMEISSLRLDSTPKQATITAAEMETLRTHAKILGVDVSVLIASRMR
jgi:hypothetical protein